MTEAIVPANLVEVMSWILDWEDLTMLKSCSM